MKGGLQSGFGHTVGAGVADTAGGGAGEGVATGGGCAAPRGAGRAGTRRVTSARRGSGRGDAGGAAASVVALGASRLVAALEASRPVVGDAAGAAGVEAARVAGVGAIVAEGGVIGARVSSMSTTPPSTPTSTNSAAISTGVKREGATPVGEVGEVGEVSDEGELSGLASEGGNASAVYPAGLMPDASLLAGAEGGTSFCSDRKLSSVAASICSRASR